MTSSRCADYVSHDIARGREAEVGTSAFRAFHRGVRESQTRLAQAGDPTDNFFNSLVVLAFSGGLNA